MGSQLNSWFVFALFSVIMCTVSAQTSYHKVFSGNGYDKGEGVIQLEDSSFLITGSSSSFEDAPSQAFLLNIDQAGNFLWSKPYGGAEFEEGKRVLELKNVGYYGIGSSSSGVSADFDIYLYHTNLFGDLIWETRTDQGAWERANDAILMPDTSIIVVGETDSTFDGNSDIFILRYAKNGSLIWKQQIGGSGNDHAFGVVKETDSTFIVAGTYYRLDSLQNKGYVAKFHKNGSLIWDTTIGTYGNFQLNDVLIKSGVIRVAGQRIKTGKSDFDAYHAVLAFDGTIISEEDFYEDQSNRISSIVNYSAGAGDKFFVSYQTISVNIPTYPDGEDALIFRFNSGLSYDGYGVSYSGIGQDQINDIYATKDGFGIAVGFHTTYGAGGNSVMVLKIGDENVFPVFTSNPDVDPLVSIYEVPTLKNVQISPNPFQNSFQLNVENEFFDYEIRSINGLLIQSGSEFSKTQINSDSWQAGVYFCTIQTEKGEATIKLVKY